MTNYEQQLIRDLRRSQGKIIGKLEKRLDRTQAKLELTRMSAKSTLARLIRLEELWVVTFNKQNGPPPPPPKN